MSGTSQLGLVLLPSHGSLGCSTHSRGGARGPGKLRALRTFNLARTTSVSLAGPRRRPRHAEDDGDDDCVSFGCLPSTQRVSPNTREHGQATRACMRRAGWRGGHGYPAARIRITQRTELEAAPLLAHLAGRLEVQRKKVADGVEEEAGKEKNWPRARPRRPRTTASKSSFR